MPVGAAALPTPLPTAAVGPIAVLWLSVLAMAAVVLAGALAASVDAVTAVVARHALAGVVVLAELSFVMP